MKLIKQDDTLSFRYSSIPSSFLYNEPYKSMLSSNAKLAYIIILDRLRLSIKNNFVNDQKEVFIYLPRKELGNLLHCTDKTIVKIFKELNALKLIYEQKRGVGKTIKIYVSKIKELYSPIVNFTIINRKKSNYTTGNYTIK